MNPGEHTIELKLSPAQAIQIEDWSRTYPPIKATVTTIDSRTCQSIYFLKTASLGERLTLAIKSFGLFLGIAVACVFIPVLHFVLVPVFLVTALVLFFKNFRTKNIVIGGFTVCPACQFEINLEGTKYSDGIRTSCQRCDQLLIIKSES